MPRAEFVGCYVGNVISKLSGEIETQRFIPVLQLTFVVPSIGVQMNLLLRRNPPLYIKPTGEEYLLWAVLRQAAHDIRRGHEQQALDAYEFLSSTGLWMLQYYFMQTEDRSINAIASLVRRYNARAIRPLPIRRLY